MGEIRIPDNEIRTKSALVSLSEETENVTYKVVGVRSRVSGKGSGVVWSSDWLGEKKIELSITPGESRSA